jgi:spore maturation protein CgeB
MAEMAKAIGGAKISLAFLRKENRDDYTQRTFEIPACGGVLLAERTARHLDFYQEGVEAEFFDANSNDDLVSKALFLLKNDVHREKLRGAGRAALLRQQHTYEDRVARLIELYSLRCRVTVNPKIDTTKVG